MGILERFWSKWSRARYITAFSSILTDETDGWVFLTQNGSLMYQNITPISS
jgi:hypothetical protein